MAFQHSFVYILRCSDNSYYSGVTANIELRVQQHNDGNFKGCLLYTSDAADD